MIFILGIILLILVVSEFLLELIIKFFRKDFQWLITEKDDYPDFDRVAFNKFILNSFDKELGWVKKPCTNGREHGKFGNIHFNIDNEGSRENSIQSKTSIVTFGDSYTFCRHVEDKHTWQVYLSKKLNDKVLNFGIGNYGADQALLYYQRQAVPKSTKVVILGFVPETICRIHSYWKHYLEFGNIFAFKPRFTLENGQLKFHANLLNGVDDFHNLDKIIESVKKNDDFYEKKFRRLQFRFPYLLRYFLNFKRNSILLYFLIKKNFFSFLNIFNKEIDNQLFSKIMMENIKHSHEMYKDEKACNLLEAILKKFCDLAYERGHKPLIVVMPQLMDLKTIKKTSITPYQLFFSKINKKVPVIDMTPYLKKLNLNKMYTEDVYGGHFSKFGNKLVAEKIFEYLGKDYSK